MQESKKLFIKATLVVMLLILPANIASSETESNLIEIKNVSIEKNAVNITYLFDNSYVIGDYASVKIWIANETNNRVKEYTDTFLINKNPPINRNILIKLPENLKGFHYIYFALSDDIDNYVKYTVVLGESKLTGKTILDVPKNKFISYIIFLLIIGAGIFFIIRRHGENIHETSGTTKSKTSR